MGRIATTEQDDPRSRDDGEALTDFQVLVWGALGGFFFIAAQNGLFDARAIGEMLEKSTQPEVQLAGLSVYSVVVVAAAAAWARLHRPIVSALVAVQLGIVAPTAITTLVGVGATEIMERPEGTASIGGILVSPAYAQGVPAPTSGPGAFECIVRSIVKKPC